MNSFGREFRVSIYGSSHSKQLGVFIDGCNAEIRLNIDDFTPMLNRRKPGEFGTTTRIETDIPEILSGVSNGITTGSRIHIAFNNQNIRPEDYEFDGFFRPGHADFTSFKKYKEKKDLSGGGQASGRMTVALVAAGVVAQKMLNNLEINSNILEIGGYKEFDDILKFASQKKDSLGGLIECTVKNLPIGWGEPFFDSLESVISHAMFSIPGIKAIEFGEGIKGSKMLGSEFNDCIIDKSGKTTSNNSGGINGGISNGNDLYFRVYIRPTASIGLEQKTFNFNTEKIETFKIKGRHDTCFALRLPPVIEAVTAIALADLKIIYSKNNS
jgi:chorismate synthase